MSYFKSNYFASNYFRKALPSSAVVVIIDRPSGSGKPSRAQREAYREYVRELERQELLTINNETIILLITTGL